MVIQMTKLIFCEWGLDEISSLLPSDQIAISEYVCLFHIFTPKFKILGTLVFFKVRNERPQTIEPEG